MIEPNTSSSPCLDPTPLLIDYFRYAYLVDLFIQRSLLPQSRPTCNFLTCQNLGLTTVFTQLREMLRPRASSLCLTFCFCGNDQALHYNRIKCLWFQKLNTSTTFETWFVITILKLWCNLNYLWMLYNLWMVTVELIMILVVNVENLRSFEISRTTRIILA